MIQQQAHQQLLLVQVVANVLAVTTLVKVGIYSRIICVLGQKVLIFPGRNILASASLVFDLNPILLKRVDRAPNPLCIRSRF
jgi:hypothetical protein